MTPVDVDGHAAPGDQEPAPDDHEDFDNLDDLDEQHLRVVEGASKDAKDSFIASRKQFNMNFQKSIASMADTTKGLHTSFDELRSSVLQGTRLREVLHREWEETMANGREVTEAMVQNDLLVRIWEASLDDNLQLCKERLKRARDTVERAIAACGEGDFDKVMLAKKNKLALADALRHVKQVEEEFDDICGLAGDLFSMTWAKHISDAFEEEDDRY